MKFAKLENQELIKSKSYKKQMNSIDNISKVKNVVK